MKVKLLRDARITALAGEIVEVSPAQAEFLISVELAEKVAEKATQPAVEVAETAVKAPKATTLKKSTPATKTTRTTRKK